VRLPAFVIELRGLCQAP